MAVYNTAGERVRSLYSGPASAAPGAVSLSQPALIPGLGSVTLLMDSQPATGPAALAWDGTNDQGQAVAPGTYYLKVETRDPFGQATVFDLAVQALAAPLDGAGTLDIYNSAGERVASLALSPAASIVDFSLAQDSFVAGASGGLVIHCVDSSGAPQTLVWDGRNAAGQAVAAGVYTLLPRSQAGTSSLKAIDLTILSAPGLEPTAPHLAPDPAQPGATSLSIQGPASGQDWTLNLYNVAGERVRQGGGKSGALLQVPLAGLSGGLYVAEIRTRDGQGRPWRWELKAAILR